MKILAAIATMALCCTTAWAQPKADPKAVAPIPSPPSEPVRAKPASTLRLNLNSAKAPELARLPGLTDAHARAIVKGRPYRSKEELVTRKILPADVYEGIKSNLFAGR